MEWAISSEFTGACIFHFSEAKMWFLYNVSEAISGHGTAFCCFVLKADKNLMFGLFSAWNNPCSSIILSDCQPHSLILLQYARWFLSANSVRQQLVGWPGAVMKTFTLRSHPPLEDSWQKDPNHQQFLFQNFFRIVGFGENSGVSSQGPTWAKPLNFTETFTLTHHWLGQYSGQHQCPGIRWGAPWKTFLYFVCNICCSLFGK